MATKAEVQRELDDAWRDLETALADLREEELLEPGVVGQWSAKDLLGHIAFWNQRAAKNLSLITEGDQAKIVRPASLEALNEWNEREWRLRKDRSLEQVRQEWLDSHRQAREALLALPEDKLSLDLGPRTVLHLFGEDTYYHYREHTDHILTWRRELETTEA